MRLCSHEAGTPNDGFLRLAGIGATGRYERRRPEKTPLCKIVAECLEGWLAG